MSSYNEYLKVCNEHLGSGRQVNDPTVHQIMQVAPHLEFKEAQQIHESEETIAFLGPPVFIRGANQVFRLVCPSSCGDRYLYRDSVYRRKESFVCKRNQSPTVTPIYKEWDYLERTSNYAEIQWGSHLSWDRSVVVAVIELLLPNEDPAAFATCRDRFGVSLCLNLDEIQQHQHQPLSVSLNDAINDFTDGDARIAELISGNVTYYLSYCGRCGSSIVNTRCSFCGTEFRLHFTPEPVTAMALPTALAEVFDRSDFVVDPIQARKAEFRAWSYDGVSLMGRRTGEKYSRSVDLNEDHNAT